jgi:uncharacterized protein (DUF1330 family)
VDARPKAGHDGRLSQSNGKDTPMALPGYLVGQLRITNETVFRNEYAPFPGQVQKQFGGRFLVRSDRVELLEGVSCGPRLVVIEFPSTEAARAYYHSPDYQRLAPIRQRSCETTLILAEGYGGNG